MSKKGPKSKDTGSRIQWFEIDEDGEIAPAFPEEKAADKPPSLPEGVLQDSSLKGIEPTFDIPITPDLMEPIIGGPDSSSPSIVPSVPTPIIPEDLDNPVVPSKDDSHLKQLSQLKPQVDAVSAMPGSQLRPEQAEVLKKYIAIKEAEVRDLRDQIKAYQTILGKSNAALKTQVQRGQEVVTQLEVARRHEEALKKDLQEQRAQHEDELQLMKSDYAEKMRLAGNVEAQAEDFGRRREEWREKIREDLKRIRLKERELENKHELLKRDMQALLDSKDKHLLELKRKNDALELELESLEERLRNLNTVLSNMDSKKKRLVETLRLSISLLETIDQLDVKPERPASKKTGSDK